MEKVFLYRDSPKVIKKIYIYNLVLLFIPLTQNQQQDQLFTEMQRFGDSTFSNRPSFTFNVCSTGCRSMKKKCSVINTTDRIKPIIPSTTISGIEPNQAYYHNMIYRT